MRLLYCFGCPLLIKLPLFTNLYNFNSTATINKQQFIELRCKRYLLTCFRYRFEVPNPSKQMFKSNLTKYTNNKEVIDQYLNPGSPYIIDYNNNIADVDQVKKLRIGYINSDNKLIYYELE